MDEEQKATNFTAQPATVLKELPFEPQLIWKPAVELQPFKLQSEESRAACRVGTSAPREGT